MADTQGTEVTLTIPINQSRSNRLRFADLDAYKAGKQLPKGISIIAPDVAFTNTIKLFAGSTTAQGIVESGGADIELRRYRVTTIHPVCGWDWIEIISVNGSDVLTAEAAARTFKVLPLED